MGAPKQKWTPEEEAALKAGVLRHGQGKWRTILKDPDFSGVLYLRSNVDLKDKWRNMSVMANGFGSREKARLALKKMHQAPKQDDIPKTLANVEARSDEDTSEAKPIATSCGSPLAGGSRKSIIRLDNLIMDAINNLKEPGGSNKASISAYIEDQYWAPPDFKRLLSAKLKYLTATGKLVKMKRKYTIAMTLISSEIRNPPILLLEGRQKSSPKQQTDSKLSKMRSATREEAAEAAARAVAEAEAAIAEAEEAARAAEAAETEAEAAQAFAEAAMKTLQWRPSPRMMIRA
ncbi:unnamed protein product [Cuscuta campestris]|uniref:MYB transcription factor n=1 Tax=Cuscuta campestris TaxID=132261 RepID=A0A484LP27_9ASTE|nr:unnamed protein product [Cuscuta campestris]